MTANEKAKLLGLFFWLYTVFNVVIVAVIAAIYIGIFGFVLTQTPQRPGQETPPEFILPMLIVIFAAALGFTILFSVPKMIAGYGLRNHRPWAKGWTIAASIMACMSFPIGTALGVFGLVFAFGDDGKKYLNDPQFFPQQLATTDVLPVVPEPNSWR